VCCVTDLGQGNEMIISGSFFTTFVLRINFCGSWGSCKELAQAQNQTTIMKFKQVKLTQSCETHCIKFFREKIQASLANLQPAN
jgi:hypothetical protein